MVLRGPESMKDSKGAWLPQETPLYVIDVETEAQIHPREAPILTPALDDVLGGASTIPLALEKVPAGQTTPGPWSGLGPG